MHTKIINFIEAVDKDLYEIIERLCIKNILNVKKNNGITFLLPQDEKFRKEIKDKSKSDNPDDVDLAAEMISSLVLIDNLKNANSFMEHRDDIPNLLGNKLEIEGVSGTTILLKGGLSIVPDERFVDGSKGKKLSVWKLNGGAIPLNGPKAVFKYKNSSKQKNEHPSEARGLRKLLASQVESSYITNFSSPNSPYIETVLSLVGFMLNNEYCKETLINKVLPTICYDKTDFYLLFEPYRSDSNYLISDNIIIDWFKSKKTYSLAAIVKKINNLLDNSSTAAALMYSNNVNALNIIDKCRENLLKTRFSPTTLTKRIERSYNELFKQKILPDELIAYYGSGEKKMHIDEFRFVIFQMFIKLESAMSFNKQSYDRILSIISNYMGGGDIRPILLKNNLASGIPSIEKIAEIKIFINSSMFFYMPLSFEQMKNYPHKFILSKPKPSGICSIYNISEILHRRCKKFIETLPKTDDNFKQTLLELKKEGKLDDYIKELTNE